MQLVLLHSLSVLSGLHQQLLCTRTSSFRPEPGDRAIRNSHKAAEVYFANEKKTRSHSRIRPKCFEKHINNNTDNYCDINMH